MGQKINIPSQNQPFRKQSSLGGDVSFRNLNGTNDNSFITLAKVTKVYYKQGKLDFKLTNTVSIVQEQGGDGSGSAPIPVDFFGRKPDGQVFGHYRPVKVGDLIAIAYINGHRSNPIVIGVYPDSAPDYELISPSMFETGDDNDSGIAETGLAEQKVYPSMQTSYRSGSGTIAEALNGHSFLILDDETANQYDQLWTDYESVGFFNHNGETTNPLKEEAGSWLLVHEDNPDGDGDGHRTRFYVNPKGEIQIVLMGSDSEGDVSVLEGSRKDGFTLKHYNDLSSIKAGDKGQDVYNPDFDVAKKYVELNIGKDQSILMQAVDQGFSGSNTNLTVKPDGVYLNDKPLNASITDSVREHSKEVADAISKDLTSTKEWEDFDKRVTQAGKDAKDAGDKAKQAGEDAKQAGISAEKAGEDAKKTGEDIKRHVIYYASAFPQGDHYIPGKYLAINTETYIANGIIKSAMIEDGAIDNAKIAYEAVGSSQIEDLAVTRGKLAYMAVGTAQIEDLAVSDEKVDHLSFNHMEGELLDAHKIRVRNLEGDSISAKTLTADKLIIGELGDITDKLGTIADGKIIVKGNGKNSGVDIEGLDADNPDVYTPSKKAVLINIVRAIKSSAEASLDYAKQVGLDTDPVAKDLQTKYDAMVDGLAPLFQDMTATTNFDHNTVEQLTSDCNNAIDKFQNLANSQLNRKIGQTADNKNSVYQGYEQPANPHINDIWFQENSDGTYQIKVYDGGSWISPGMQDIKEVREYMQNLPRNYYQASAPTGNISAGSTWYKLERGLDGNYTYTPYKWENKQWVKMLSSDQVVDFHNIQSLQKDLNRVNGTLVELNNQVIADKRNIQADYNGKIEGINRVVNTNKETTDKALNDNLNIAKGYADGKANGALASAQTYADGKANGALASATKYVDTQLKISKEGLESQILGTGGGVNLALTSDSDWSVPASGAYIGDSNKCIELSRYVLDGDNFSKGDTITYSVHLSFSGIKGNNPTMTLQSVLSNNDWSHAIYPNCNINAITQNSNYEVTLKGTATLDPFPTALGTYILQIRFDHITAGTVKYCKVKIEKGSVATPYVASDTSYRSLIKATDSKIEGAVMKGTDYAGMVITPEHGFTAVANNMNFTLNKTAGFVINNKSDNIFKVDPSGNLTMKGNLVAGNISGVNFTGQSLNLAGSLKVSGSILSSNGNVAISSNGLTVKDGGLKIVNSNNETTTMIRDDGTFATNKGYFSGEVHTTKLILSGNDSDINMGGKFMVDSQGNVTAKSITITGGTVDAGSTHFKNFSADIITAGILRGSNGEFYLDSGALHVWQNNHDAWIDQNGIHDYDHSGNNVWIKKGGISAYGNTSSIDIRDGEIHLNKKMGISDGVLASDYGNIKKVDNILQFGTSGLDITGTDGFVLKTDGWDSSVINRMSGEPINGSGMAGNKAGYMQLGAGRQIILYAGSPVSDGIAKVMPRLVLGGALTNGESELNGWFSSYRFTSPNGSINGGFTLGQNSVLLNSFDGKSGLFTDSNSATLTAGDNYISVGGIWPGVKGDFNVNGEVNITNNHGLTAKNVHVTGWLGVDGSKNSIVRTSQGTVAINAYETAEYYFGDIGEGQTNSNGVAYVGIEKLFNETVNTSIPYQVFITAYGPGNVWVEQRKQDRFMVKSSQPNIKFGWEIKAKRKGYEHTRLQNVDNMIEKPAGIK